MIISNRIFSLSFSPCVSIHSIKCKLEPTSINVLFVDAYTLLLFITFLYYEANKTFSSLSLSPRFSHSLTHSFSTLQIRRRRRHQYARKSRANISRRYKHLLLLVLAYSFVAHIHLFNTDDNSFTRYYLDPSLSFSLALCRVLLSAARIIIHSSIT